MRLSILPLILILLLPPCPAPACSLCGTPKLPLALELDDAHAAVYGYLANPKLTPGTGTGTTEFHIEKIVKDHPDLPMRKMILLSRYLPILDGNVRALRAVVALGPWRNVDAASYHVKGAELRLAVLLGIPGATQESSDFFGVHLVAIADGPREGIDFCGIAEDRGAEALFNDAVVSDVKVAKGSTQTHGGHQKDDQGGSDHWIARQSTPCFAAFGAVLRDLDFDGQG